VEKESIGFGTATDPYQPIEGTYKISRGVIEALRDRGHTVGIVTKGPMMRSRHRRAAGVVEGGVVSSAYERADR
jgi:DNA repair photolyase